MLTLKTIPKKIECFLPPTVMYAPYTQVRYAIIGGVWFPCDETVTREILQERWSRPKTTSPPTKDIGDVIEKVKSSSGKDVYTVTLKNKMWSCTCPSYGFRRKCKHIDQVKSKKH